MKRKTALLGPLTGDVLELGPGSGGNLHYYGTEVRWVGFEPNVHLHQAIARRAVARGYEARTLTGFAEAIPLPDASVDAVVGTLVLCSVDHQAAALAEIRRVLRHGGRYVFLEHVAAPAGTRRRHLQRAFVPVCRYAADGCHFDRETLGAILAAGLRRVEHQSFTIPTRLGLFSPHIAGTATR